MDDIIDMFQNLLDEAKNLYAYYPNKHRMSAEQYFEIEIDFLNGLRENHAALKGCILSRPLDADERKILNDDEEFFKLT